jgi:methyl-accepting chemotaxis protein
MKLSRKISLAGGAVVFVVAATIGGVAVVLGSNAVEAQVVQVLQAQVNLGAQLVAKDLSTRLQVLQELADRARVRTLDWTIQKPSLLPDVEAHGYQDLAIVTPDGTAKYVLEATTAQLGDRDYVKTALGGRPVVSDVLISRVTGKPVVMAAVPVMVGNAVKQALVARMEGTALTTLIKTMGFGKTGYAYLVNKKGVVVAHPDADLVLKQFAPIEAAKTDPTLVPLAKTFEAMIANGKGTGEYYFEKRNIVVGYTSVPGTDLTLAVAAEKGEFQQGTRDLVTVLLLVMLGLMVAGIVSALVIARAISAPIVMTARRLGEVQQGILDRGSRLPVTSKDELGALASSFNSFLESLYNMIQTIEATAGQLGRSGAGLSANMTQTSAAVVEIMANLESLKDRIATQAVGVTETLATVEKISHHIGSVNGNIESQAANVVQVSSAVEMLSNSIKSLAGKQTENTANLAQLTAASNVGKTKVSAVVNLIQSIGVAAEGMLEASDVISNIAAQTNLLSMNAAIEAAHAGNSGKGFAVVADEIRKLAENSAQQTSSISTVLASIKQSIDTAVATSREADASFDGILEQVTMLNKMDYEIKNAMMTQGMGGDLVLESIQGIDQVLGRIRAESAEILAGSQDILNEMNRLTAITQEINDGASEMALGAKEIVESVTEVTELSVQNRESVVLLESQVGKFQLK